MLDATHLLIDSLFSIYFRVGAILYVLGAPFLLYSIRTYFLPPNWRRRDLHFRLIIVVLVVAVCVGLGYTATLITEVAFAAKEIHVLRDIESQPLYMLELLVLFTGTLGLPVAFVLAVVATPPKARWLHVFGSYFAALLMADVVLTAAVWVVFAHEGITIKVDGHLLWGSTLNMLLLNAFGAWIGSAILFRVLAHAESKRCVYGMVSTLAAVCFFLLGGVLVFAAFGYFGFAARKIETVRAVFEEWHDIGFVLSDSSNSVPSGSVPRVVQARGIKVNYWGTVVGLCPGSGECDRVAASFVLGRGGLCEIYFIDRPQDVTVQFQLMQQISVTKGTALTPNTMLTLPDSLLLTSEINNISVKIPITLRNMIRLKSVGPDAAGVRVFWPFGLWLPYNHMNIGVGTSSSNYVLRDAGAQEVTIFVDAERKGTVAHIEDADNVEAIGADTGAALLGEKLEAFTALDVAGRLEVGTKELDIKRGQKVTVDAKEGELNGVERDGKLVIQGKSNRVSVNNHVVNATVIPVPPLFWDVLIGQLVPGILLLAASVYVVVRKQKPAPSRTAGPISSRRDRVSRR